MHRLAQNLKRTLLLIATLSLGLGVLVGCNNAETADTSESTEPEGTTESFNRSVSEPIAATNEVSDTGEETHPGADILASASNSSTIKLSTIIGTMEDGWLPKAVTKYNLQRGMSPEEVGKIIPGAEKISKFGFSEVPAKDVPGVDKYKFSFLKDKKDPDQKQTLYSISLLFDPAIKKNLPYEKVALAFAEKYGEVTSDKIERRIVTWGGPKYATAQLTHSINKFEGYEFKIVIPKS